MRLDEVRFEVFAEKISDAHRVEANGVVDHLFAELREFLGEIDHFANVPGPERGGIRGCAQQQRADELALTHDVGRIPAVGVGITGVVSREFAPLHVLVRVIAEDVSVARDRHPTAIGHDLQSVARQLQVAEDLRSQQAANVRAVRVDPPFLNLTADRCTADPRVTLEHQHLEPGAREVGGVRQAVVAGADDDCIVGRHAAGAFIPRNARVRSHVPRSRLDPRRSRSARGFPRGSVHRAPRR